MKNTVLFPENQEGELWFLNVYLWSDSSYVQTI